MIDWAGYPDIEDWGGDVPMLTNWADYNRHVGEWLRCNFTLEELKSLVADALYLRALRERFAGPLAEIEAVFEEEACTQAEIDNALGDSEAMDRDIYEEGRQEELDREREYRDG